MNINNEVILRNWTEFCSNGNKLSESHTTFMIFNHNKDYWNMYGAFFKLGFKGYSNPNEPVKGVYVSQSIYQSPDMTSHYNDFIKRVNDQDPKLLFVPIDYMYYFFEVIIPSNNEV